jgi:7-cyano-7-deazaguanine synthase
MKGAVLLLSSGLDSAANLVSGDFKVQVALTVDYGQRGAARELEHAARLAQRFGVEHVAFDLRGFGTLVGAKSALLQGGGALPSPESLDDPAVTRKSAAAVWVPNRNGVLLGLAAALAESRSLDAVAVGFNAEEAVTFPDNTREYIGAMSRALAFSTSNHVEVVSATAALTKREIVAKLGPDFPYELLWSCYEAGEDHCGFCESCKRLRRALNEGLAEPGRGRALKALFPAGAHGPVEPVEIG